VKIVVFIVLFVSAVSAYALLVRRGGALIAARKKKAHDAEDRRLK
jgi:hypothetical protein